MFQSIKNGWEICRVSLLLSEIKLPGLLDQTPDLLKMELEDFKKKRAQEKKTRQEEIRRRFEGRS